MATYDERLAALERDATAVKRDIIYKLDDTNSAVTIIKGIVNQDQDIREIKNQVKIVDARLNGIDIRLEGLKEEIRMLKAGQDAQGRDITEIKRHLDALEVKFGAMEAKSEQNFTSLTEKFGQVLQLLTSLTNKAE